MSEFNPSSRKKPKKEEKKKEPSPAKATKVDSGEERRRRFRKLWKERLSEPFHTFFTVTIASGIRSGICAYAFMAVVGLVFSFFPFGLLIYIAFLLILNLVCRYFYPDSFKRKK